MKKNHQAKSLNLPTSRWLAYAAAGTATALAGTHSAEAEIHYSGPIKYRFHGLRSQDQSFRLFGNQSLVFDRKINYTGPNYSYNGFDAHFEINAQNGSVAGFFYTCAFSTSVASVSNLDRGDAISQRPFVPDGGILVTADGLGCGGGRRGQFFPAGTGFIGFKFDLGQGVQYGWARIKIGSYPENQYELVDYAYADPGEPIAAGQRRSAKAQIPAQGGLAILALGATGLMAWRRQRRHGATG
jgi:hypothetical protein